MKRGRGSIRFRLDLEYQGTRYSGWQVQKNARTVQGELVKALTAAAATADFMIQGAGRTDAGVHALHQVAHLDLKTSLRPEILRRKINDALPYDINVLSLQQAPKNFHARHDAVCRSYLYQIATRRTAFGKKLVWWVQDELDTDEMEKVGQLFLGMKDFQSFSADEPDEKSTRVLVERFELMKAGPLILIRVEGSHFLWKMVRRLVGVLVEVGKGELSLSEIRSFFQAASERPAQLTAPASGLFLERVYYPGDRRLEDLTPVVNMHGR